MELHSDHIPSQPERTEEEVTRAAEAAGLTGSEGSVQLLHFSSQLHSEEIRIMEVPKPVLEALRSGEKVVIRGTPADAAVLCTNDKTFDLRIADTSNTLLIAPSLRLPTQSEGSTTQEVRSCEITACLANYLELRLCPPKTERLKALLAEWPFRGAEYETEGAWEESQGWGVGTSEETQGWGAGESVSIELREESIGTKSKKRKKQAPKKYSFEELLNLVQASEEELYEVLDTLQACPIGGHWRCLDLDYRDRLFQHVLTLLDEKDWSYHRVPMKATCQLLSELEPKFAIEHCFVCYGTKLEDDDEEEEEREGEDKEVYYELSELKVCQFYAELLLRPAGKFSYQDFLDSWQESVPQGMHTSIQQLKGLALTDLTSVPPAVLYLSVASLPQDPLARFKRLFQVREKWTLDEIEPYIKDLETPTLSLNALLMRHSRVSADLVRGKLYSSKILT